MPDAGAALISRMRKASSGPFRIAGIRQARFAASGTSWHRLGVAEVGDILGAVPLEAEAPRGVEREMR